MTDYIRVCRTCLHYREGICAENSSQSDIYPQDYCSHWCFTVERQERFNVRQGSIRPGDDPYYLPNTTQEEFDL